MLPLIYNISYVTQFSSKKKRGLQHLVLPWIIRRYRSWIVYAYNTHQTQTNENRKRNEQKTNERFTQTIRKTHDTRNKRTIHETNARYTNERTKWNERTIRKRKRTNTRYTKRANDTQNERTIHERTHHWSVAIYYPMTNDPGSIEVQYSIVLLFEWLLCKLMWLTNLIFYTQLIQHGYINDELVGKVIG
jgi:hypothetical protein